MSQGILLPELVIHRTLVTIVKMLRDDLEENNGDETQSLLYKILGVDEQGQALKLNLYDVFKQAKKIVQTKQNLSVNFGYNQEVANIISMHILLPSEQGSMTIGAEAGYLEADVFDDDGNKIGVQQYYTQTYESTYQIMITSNNSAEVNVVYNILKSMLLMLVPHLELMALRLPTLSGNDIVMQDDLVPVPIFHKVLNLSFKYEHNVPKLTQERIAKQFYVTMRMIDFDQD